MRATDVRFSPLGLAAAIAFSAPAFAQTQPDGDRVVITATRQAESADTLPQSISVLSGDDLDGVDGAEDIVHRLAGVQVAISNGSQATFQIRGVGAVDHQALTPGAAAVHVDGVFLATNVQASLLAYDLARVEVLKGPQGTIQGRNASSGSINFITATPTDAQTSYAEISYGRFDRWDVSAAVSGRLAEGVRGRLADLANIRAGYASGRLSTLFEWMGRRLAEPMGEEGTELAIQDRLT